VYYTQSILLGKKSLYIRRRRRKEKEKEKINDVLKGLIEEVRALYKEVAPIKETYVERLKKDLPSSLSLLPSLLTLSPTPSTSTRSKKKQL